MDYYQKYMSPIGLLHLIATNEFLRVLAFDGNLLKATQGKLPGSESINGVLKQTIKELDEYFAGERKSFSVPCEPSGTAFRQKVWKALSNIPYGQTISYSELAENIGQGGSYRAVAQANSHNPISIIIPCHRVIASSGKLSGYAGGIHNKQYLLDLES